MALEVLHFAKISSTYQYQYQLVRLAEERRLIIKMNRLHDKSYTELLFQIKLYM